MTITTQRDAVLRIADLPERGATDFQVEPGADDRAALASAMELNAVRKLRLSGRIVPEGRNGWRLDAQLGATVVQPCVVTLDPVTTRIDEPVIRRYLPAEMLPALEPDSETEAPEDDSVEPLSATLDLWSVMTEALALTIPAYPRKDDASLGEAVFAEDGVTPLSDADLKPFSGLKDLRDKLAKDGNSDES